MTQWDALAEAHAAHDRRDWKAAAAAYDRHLAAGGSAAQVADAYGDVLTELSRFGEAMAAYAIGLAAAPEDASLAFRLARAAERAGDPRRARESVRAACESPGLVDGVLAHRVGPLPLSITAEARLRLRTAGWPVSAAATPSGEEAAGLALTAVGEAPDLQITRLVACACWGVEGLSRAEALTLARLAEEIAPRSAVTLLFVADTPAARAETGVLEAEAQRAGVTIRVMIHAGRAPVLQLHGLALELAAGFHADALCATSLPSVATPPPPDAFDDPMLGFVVWRRADTASSWRHTPCAAAPLVLVRDRVLQEAGSIDAAYESVAAALTDLMMRANRMGFCAVGRAATYLGPTVADPDPADERLLHLRYPEHRAKLRQAQGGVAAEVERLSAALARPRDLALDLTGLRAWHDGTSELSVALAKAMARDPRFDLKLICSEAAARHHGLDRLPGAVRLAPESRPTAAACFKVGQPFTFEELLFTWSVAPIAGFHMLDAISLDVERLSVETDLDLLWRLLFEHSELIGHLSDYTRDQMARRFGERGARGFVALCSTAADEYPAAKDVPAGADVLLVGNAYEHKNLLGAVQAIHAASPGRRLTVVGRTLEPRPNVNWINSGGLSHARVQQLYAEASAVVFPSLYEGFGLPIMHALAARRPVLAVDQPVFREIRDRTRWAGALHLFPTTSALAYGLDAVCFDGFPSKASPAREHRWSDAARTIGDAVAGAITGLDPAALTRRVTAAAALAGG